MGVPESIRSVSRPKNTVVIDTGSKGIHRYVVRERNGTICKKGRIQCLVMERPLGIL